MLRWRGIQKTVLYCLKDRPLNCFTLPLSSIPTYPFYTRRILDFRRRLTGVESFYGIISISKVNILLNHVDPLYFFSGLSDNMIGISVTLIYYF
jgi:hypothetical protein